MALAAATTVTPIKSNPVLTPAESGTYPVRAAVVLTTSYVDTDHIPCERCASVGFIVTVDAIDHTSIQLAIEGSLDGSVWYQLPIDGAATAAPVTYTSASMYKDGSSTYAGAFRALVKTPIERFVRASVKYTGGTAVGTVKIDAVPGVMT